jgi:hypothetical protein
LTDTGTGVNTGNDSNEDSSAGRAGAVAASKLPVGGINPAIGGIATVGVETTTLALLLLLLATLNGAGG